MFIICFDVSLWLKEMYTIRILSVNASYLYNNYKNQDRCTEINLCKFHLMSVCHYNDNILKNHTDLLVCIHIISLIRMVAFLLFSS